MPGVGRSGESGVSGGLGGVSLRGHRGAIGGGRDEDPGNAPDRVAVAFGDGGLEGFDAVGGDEVDGAPAEAATGHAGADESGGGPGEFDQRVEFGAADFVIVAEAGVGIRHEAAEGGEVGAAEGFGELFHAEVFADDVAAATLDDFGEAAAEFLQVGRGVTSRRARMSGRKLRR
jgi:hypothetical protein